MGKTSSERSLIGSGDSVIVRMKWLDCRLRFLFGNRGITEQQAGWNRGTFSE